jgi:type 1 glutamine amidotransferase
MNPTGCSADVLPLADDGEVRNGSAEMPSIDCGGLQGPQGVGDMMCAIGANPMKIVRILTAALIIAGLSMPLSSPLRAQQKRKRLLVIGAVKGFQHDSTSQAMATLWNLGRESALWDTYIKTDTQWITKKKLDGNAKNLDYFDAVAFYTTGELDMDDEQKAALLAFVRDDGKGFLGVHSAIDTFYKWPEFGEMTGAYFNEHPWGTFEAPVILEDPTNPIVRHFPSAFTTWDEIYQPSKEFSREKVRVLLRLDETKLDLKNPRVHRTDNDFAVAWLKTYGKGRVFYSTFGHTPESWDRPDVRKMWLEATKWCLGDITVDTTPRPRPAQ